MTTVHFASFIAKTHPHQLSDLREMVSSLPTVVDWVSDDQHQLVFVVECQSSEQLNQTMTKLHALPNLLSIDLIYHETENAERLDEEMVI